MYLSGLLARNFRSLENVNVKFRPGLNVLVGKNNAGKSNIIEALDYVLGEKWPTYRQIEERTFFRSGAQQPPSDWFLLSAKLEGGQISYEAISRLSARKTKTISIDRYPPFRSAEELSNWLEEVEQNRSTWCTYTELASDLDQAAHIFLFLYVPRGVARSEREYGLVYSNSEGLYYVPNLSSEIRNLLLTTAYIPAFRDPYHQLRVNEYSWYGKLIKQLYGQQNEDQRHRIWQAQESLSDVLREIFTDATDSLRRQLARAVFHHDITFRPGAFTRDDSYKQITLFVDDGLDAPFYDKGSGIQSALILALFTHYCRSFHEGSSLLMVEEPELYLHPQARRALEGQLMQFIHEQDTGSGTHQVIVSTHSPEFLRSVSLNQLCLVCKTPGQNPTSVRQVSALSSRADQIVETKNAEMFFADHVILVEGGEEYLLPVLADLTFGESRWLDAKNVSVARVGGKGQLPAYTEVLDRFGIDWSILADLDILKDGIAPFSDKLDNAAKRSLGKLRATWDELGELPRGRKIKDKVFDKNTRDWKQLYLQVEEAISEISSGQSVSHERTDEISALWESLQDRVFRASYDELRQHHADDIMLIVDQLRPRGIFVLPKGELEDYFTEQALGLAQSKDLRAMKLAQKLSNSSSIDDAAYWLDCEDFVLLLQHVRQQLEDSPSTLPVSPA